MRSASIAVAVALLTCSQRPADAGWCDAKGNQQAPWARRWIDGLKSGSKQDGSVHFNLGHYPARHAPRRAQASLVVEPGEFGLVGSTGFAFCVAGCLRATTESGATLLRIHHLLFGDGQFRQFKDDAGTVASAFKTPRAFLHLDHRQLAAGEGDRNADRFPATVGRMRAALEENVRIVGVDVKPSNGRSPFAEKSNVYASPTEIVVEFPDRPDPERYHVYPWDHEPRQDDFRALKAPDKSKSSGNLPSGWPL